MEICTENILGLLGADSRKYHSCILTSFTFDFSFFEMQAMRALKGAGIRNVLVLLDEGVMDELTANPTGLEFTRNTGYGLYPIKAKGVFHSKLILCAGKKEGFLAIGSGNLTAAGHGSNDELWSVFHIKEVDTPNAQLFRQVCRYIGNLTRDIQGNSAEKLKWFFQYTRWIERIPESLIGDSLEFKNELIKLIPIEEGFSGFSAISKTLVEEDVREIQVLSPYYDKDGKFLSNLGKIFPDAQLKVVLDLEYGLLPFDLPDKTNTSFYDWNSCIDKKENEISRLHGKLIVFRSASGAEAFLIGSANATIPALGAMDKGAQNKELGLFIHRKKGSIFEDLGIALKPEAAVDLNEVEKNEIVNVFQHSTCNQRHLVIKVAEEDGQELIIKTVGNYSGEIQLTFYDRYARVISQFDIDDFSNDYKFILPLQDANLKRSFFISWNSIDGQDISNRQIIQSTAIHNKCNPDPENERIESIFEEIESGHFGKVADLLRYVSFSNEDDPSSPSVGVGTRSLSTNSSLEKEFPVSPSYEDFTSVSQESLLRQKGLLVSTNLRIVDFLASIRKKQLSLQTERGIRADEQIGDLEGYEGEADEEVQISTTKRTLKDCQKEKRAVQRHLKQYLKHLAQSLDGFREKGSSKKDPPQPLTITDYSNFLICAQLVVHYTELPLDDDQYSSLNTETYLGVKGDNPFDNLKDFCEKALGSFLLSQQRGDKYYELERLKNKRRQFKKDAFIYAIFLICNTYWRESEKKIKQLLLFNSALSILVEEEYRPEDLLTGLSHWVAEKKREGVYISNRFQTQFEEYKNHLFPEIVRAVNNVKCQEKKIVDSSRLTRGAYIYNFKLGICQVKKNRPGSRSDERKLTLIHPGFLKKDSDGDWTFAMGFRKNVIFDI